MSKPTKLTPETQAKIAGYVNAGAPIPSACAAASVSWNTVKVWLARGKLGEQPYADFVDAMEQAKGRWVAGSVMRITKAGDSDWKAAAWLLERRAAEDFRLQTKVDADVSHSGVPAITVYLPSNGRDPT